MREGGTLHATPGTPLRYLCLTVSFALHLATGKVQANDNKQSNFLTAGLGGCYSRSQAPHGQLLWC